MGKIYIAKMKMRGKWAKCPENTKIINVTSMQGTKNPFRRDFSPMSAIPGGYKGFYCFQNYWQSGKVFEGVNREQRINWWKHQQKGKRRFPKSKGVKPLYFLSGQHEKMSYIDSRKRVYVPEYYSLIKETDSFKKCMEMVKNGEDIAVFDFDGPCTQTGQNDIQQVSHDLLQNKINDPSSPFGHGYIIAGALAGIKPNLYTYVDLPKIRKPRV